MRKVVVALAADLFFYSLMSAMVVGRALPADALVLSTWVWIAPWVAISGLAPLAAGGLGFGHGRHQTQRRLGSPD